ncbi:hypothetical protein A2609_02400 [Candidatus Kaiserbacteria bacterium RIFOXYD1_FULL_47_14]|uniref:Uncharacterized protein n=1 Tax=Candidatus Kaiserbacteria bacterium RIFOXYD1_FULL_47_14 TaxID=1798533 RepID=A0A1F6G790_9BACT|nr:MAG: hypothetical protein A2609_02400 [Candidatus Kaiserbacteria bacterium RIFOXYD1_FULL_47_14]
MRYLVIVLFFIFACLPAGIVFAASDTPSSDPIFLINPLKGVDCSSGDGNCLSAFLASILQFVVYIGSIVVIFMLIYVGYLFVVARGVPGEITKAKDALLWTVVGALILLGAQAISLGIQATVAALSTGG